MKKLFKLHKISSPWFVVFSYTLKVNLNLDIIPTINYNDIVEADILVEKVTSKFSKKYYILWFIDFKRIPTQNAIC